MLTIIQGGLFSTADEYTKHLASLYALKSDTKIDYKTFLIVPEQQAVTAEREFIEMLPSETQTKFEVTNFTRLANTAYRIYGGLSTEYASAGKEALIMWKTLKELSGELKMTEGAKEINAGLVSRALSAMGEMKRHSVSSEEMADAAMLPEIQADKRLSEKLSDISKILSRHTELLREKYSSASDDSERLYEILSSEPSLFCGDTFVINGFTSFTNPQFKVISRLIERATVIVALPISKLTNDHFEFSEIRDTKEKLLAEADRIGAKKSIIPSEDRGCDANESIARITDLLWRSFGQVDDGCDTSSVRIYEGTDPYEASEFVAADIKRTVMNGARYSDFAIISRDGKRYAGIIDAYLNDAGIPCFISRQTDISQYEAIKLIYTAFSAIRSGFSPRDVLTYAKSGLSGVDREACDEFELYTDMWQIDGERLYSSADWDMSPDGYDGRPSKKCDEVLARINATRRSITEPLKRFASALSTADTVRDHARVLIDFLTDISLEEKLDKKCDELYSLGELTASEENGTLWKIICTALDSMVEVLGDTPISIYDFENQLKVILSEANIGKLPSYRDVVTVASADSVRISKKKYIYLFGVNAAQFPASGGGSSYFTDKDKELLAAAGLIKEEKLDTARELFFFSRAMSFAKSRVALISFKRDEAYSPCERAAVIDRICEITNGNVSIEEISDISILDKIYSPDTAMEYSEHPEVRRVLNEAGYGDKLQIAERSIENLDAHLGEGARAMLYGDDISLTQSKIDTYVSCPFSYFLGYDIKLSENSHAEFDARNIGTFIHAILENFFTELYERGITAADVDGAERSDIVKRAAEKYLGEKTNGKESTRRTSISIDRIHKAALPIIDGLCDELSDCKFTPRFFELQIKRGNDSLPSPATFEFDNGTSADVHGIIDRVDVYRSGKDAYVRVIDYKTGKKSFSPSDIDEGRNLQMFLYLKAITETENEEFKRLLGVEEGGRIIPAGVIYVKTDLGDVTIEKNDAEEEREALLKNQERRGMILDDNESIAAMNKNYIPVKYTKSGAPTAASQKNLYSEDDWAALNDRIKARILDISERMRNGEISVSSNVSREACDRCKFKSVCRKKLD